LSKLESHSTGIGDYPALVVVDMCKAFIDSSSPLGFECNELIQANINLVNKFRLNKYSGAQSTLQHNVPTRKILFNIKSLNDLNALNNLKLTRIEKPFFKKIN